MPDVGHGYGRLHALGNIGWLVSWLVDWFQGWLVSWLAVVPRLASSKVGWLTRLCMLVSRKKWNTYGFADKI